MKTSIFSPLRSTADRAVPYNMLVRSQSAYSKELNIQYEIIDRGSLAEIETDSRWLSFLPAVEVGGQSYLPQSDQWPTIRLDPVRLPFPEDAPFKSVLAQANGDQFDASRSRDFGVTFEIILRETTLVGGIAYAGYPYLGYAIDSFGRTTSNYGVPREIRISVPTAESRSAEHRFLDSDVHYTRQVINSSEGIQFFKIEPTRTRRFFLQFSDFPYLTRRLIEHADDPRGKTYTYSNQFAVVLPQLYVFTHRERSHYHFHVPGGVVGAVLKRKNRAGSTNRQEYLAPEWQRLLPAGRYEAYPASSLFRPLRAFGAGMQQPATPLPSFEQFVSDPLQPGEALSIVCEQCDDCLRSIAGMRLLIPVPSARGGLSQSELLQNVGLPTGELTLCTEVGLKIFELDFPAGVPLLDVGRQQLDKYKRLLAEKTVTDVESLGIEDTKYLADKATAIHDEQSIRFRRASNSRFFEIELRNLGKQRGSLVVVGAAFVQSAHVSVHARPAHRLRVSKLHFRIVGAELAHDYGSLGKSDFNFSIDKHVPGQVQRMLAVRSLADLVQAGVARVLGNSRRRAIEFEKNSVYVYAPHDSDSAPYATAFPHEQNKDNYELRSSHSVVDGFSRTESGSGVMYDGQELETHSSQETRAHTQHLYPQVNAVFPASPEVQMPWEAAAHYLNFGHMVFTDLLGGLFLGGPWFANQSSLLIPNQNSYLEIGFNDYWRGIKLVPRVEGMKTVSLSPFSPIAITYDAVKNLIAGIGDLLKVYDLSDQDFNLVALWQAARQLTSGAQVLSGMAFPGSTGALVYNIFNGMSLGASVGFIGGLSTGSNLITPGMTYNHSFGSQGTITTSATKGAYSKSEQLRQQVDDSAVRAVTQAGEHKRIIERREVPQTDAHRVRGAEVMWQGEVKDVVLGTIPVNVTFPALAESPRADDVDQALIVRFGNGVPEDLDVDFWFEVEEMEIRDDF